MTKPLTSMVQFPYPVGNGVSVVILLKVMHSLSKIPSTDSGFLLHGTSRILPEGIMLMTPPVWIDSHYLFCVNTFCWHNTLLQHMHNIFDFGSLFFAVWVICFLPTLVLTLNIDLPIAVTLLYLHSVFLLNYWDNIVI